MKDSEWKEYFSLFGDKELEILDYYIKDDMKKLKPIVIKNKPDYKNGNHRDQDLYDDAIKVLCESLISYDGKKAKFETFFVSNLKRSFCDWYRDNYLRASKNPLLLDAKGIIVKEEDENGKVNPIQLPMSSFDAPVKEGERDLREKISSGHSIEDEISEFTTDDTKEKVDMFLDSLPKIHRQVLLMKMKNIPTGEIKKQLNLSDGEFSNIMKSIKLNENITMFSKNKNDGNYKMEEHGMEDRVIAITESENYRTDKYSMYTLLQQKKDGDINCKYILQRKPFQWTEEEANRYFCRVLSSLPVPEIILCEQVKKGFTISYLIDGLQRLSYAEAFKNNRMKIGKSGSERHLIEYRDYILDDKGNRILDEEGLPLYERKVCDVIGKTYDELPEELKKRFNNFNFNVTKFFNCTDQQIADHIRDYNNHATMNKEQVGLTKISIVTAEKIKNITEKNMFFKNSCKVSELNKTKGKLERTVAEAIMFLFHRNEWKPKLEDAYKYVDENATTEEFDALNSDLNRLELAIGDDKKLKALFTSTSIPLWVSVFEEFTKYDLDDSRFVDFLNAYNDGLKDTTVDGVCMKDFKSAQNKQRSTVLGKFNFLVKLMRNYLNVEEIADTYESKEMENKEVEESMAINIEETLLEFVQENVRESIKQEDIDLYQDCLDDLIEDGSPVYSAGKETVVALMAYATDIDKDNEFGMWINEKNKKNNTYDSDHKKNYETLKEDFDHYCEKADDNKAA